MADDDPTVPDRPATLVVAAEPEEQQEATESVASPAKVLRIGSMTKELLEEVRRAPLDEAGRSRLREIYETSVHELAGGLSGDLKAELARLSSPFSADTPTDAELRVAQAQLVGWLEGLFHGIQTALVAQRMASQAQLAQARHALPPGVTLTGRPPGGQQGHPDGDGDLRPTPGQYL